MGVVSGCWGGVNEKYQSMFNLCCSRMVVIRFWSHLALAGTREGNSRHSPSSLSLSLALDASDICFDIFSASKNATNFFRRCHQDAAVRRGTLCIVPDGPDAIYIFYHITFKFVRRL